MGSECMRAPHAMRGYSAYREVPVAPRDRSPVPASKKGGSGVPKPMVMSSLLPSDDYDDPGFHTD
jgi:hypothetical protein